MKHVYILLTRTRTVLSRLIHFVTGDGYTHVSLALDPQLDQMYSFGRRHSYAPLPAGLVREHLDTAVYGRNQKAPCTLYRVDVTDAQFGSIRARIDTMMETPGAYRYSILGLLLCKLDLAHERHRHMFCSQFVASVLADAGVLTLPKSPSLMHPEDFQALPALVPCYEGPLGDCGLYNRRPDLYTANPIGDDRIAGTYSHCG